MYNESNTPEYKCIPFRAVINGTEQLIFVREFTQSNCSNVNFMLNETGEKFDTRIIKYCVMSAKNLKTPHTVIGYLENIGIGSNTLYVISSLRKVNGILTYCYSQKAIKLLEQKTPIWYRVKI